MNNCKNNNLFTFRRYKKKEGKKQVRHPKLIVDDYGNSFGYMGLTESKKRGKNHYNIPLEKNPINNDKRQAYLRKQIDYDDKSQFGQILNNYNLSKKDMEYIIEYVNKHKKR